MEKLEIECIIKYEIKEGKIVTQLIPTLDEYFDCTSFRKIIHTHTPTLITKEEEIEALKKVTDMLLIHSGFHCTINENL